MCVAALALIMLPAASAFGQFKQGDWELTLNGGAVHGPDLNGVSASIGGSLGYFLSDQFEISLRETATYTDFGPGSNWTGDTRAAIDFHFDMGRLQPFIGANIGKLCGELNDTWEGAPEAGLKWFLNGTTFVELLVEYQFFFDKDKTFGNALSDGQFIYALGLGVRL